MKRTALAAVALLLTTGCSPQASSTIRSGNLAAQWVQLPDGRSVVCVTGTRAISCDWATASLEGEAP